MKSEILVTLIKEVVKNEVKNQVKEELAKLIKSGAVTLNSQKKTSTPSLRELTEVPNTPVRKQPVQQVQQRQAPQREFTKDPMINEILNATQPFTAAHRAEGSVPGMSGGSILDAIQPQRTMEEDWETMNYSTDMLPDSQIPTTDNAGMDALTKALTRDYTELVKRF
jgi:23S rRNA-/tRNA-specific pseudouridylate synthase